jgi:hypothetical protein
MSCATLTAQETTMPTTQLMRAACYDVCWPMKAEQEIHRQALRMNWVVVTDANGDRRLKMSWRADRDD